MCDGTLEDGTRPFVPYLQLPPSIYIAASCLRKVEHNSSKDGSRRLHALIRRTCSECKPNPEAGAQLATRLPALPMRPPPRRAAQKAP